MSDQTITIASTSSVDAASCRVMVEGDAFSDATGCRVNGVPAQQLDTEVVTVKVAVQTSYVYCVRAARRLRWFITVKARAFAVVVESRVRAFLNNVFPKTGADILRQSAILNI